jgi:hypothetical protein
MYITLYIRYIFYVSIYSVTLTSSIYQGVVLDPSLTCVVVGKSVDLVSCIFVCENTKEETIIRMQICKPIFFSNKVQRVNKSHTDFRQI